MMDTVNLRRYFTPMWRVFKRMMKDNRGFAGEGEGTPLPESMLSDESFKDIGTVEKLAEGYKAGQTRTFMDFMPDEAKNDPSVTKYKTGEEYYKGHKNLVEMIGKKGVTLPGENASEEETGKFYNSLGRPESAEGYAFAPIEGLHPEVTSTPESEKAFKESIHKLGFTNKQADSLNNMFLTKVSNALVQRDEMREQTMKQSITELRSEWGQNYEENKTLAMRLVKVFGGDEASAAFGDLGNNPKVMKFLSNVGRKLSEDSFKNIGGIDLLADAGQAKKRISEIGEKIMGMKNSDPGYHELVKERTRLYKVAYGG